MLTNLNEKGTLIAKEPIQKETPFFKARFVLLLRPGPKGAFFMEKRLAVISVIVERPAAVEDVNRLFHEFAEHICGRMGLPCRERGVSVISVVLDAPADVINRLTGRLGMVEGVSAKTLFAKV